MGLFGFREGTLRQGLRFDGICCMILLHGLGFIVQSLAPGCAGVPFRAHSSKTFKSF